MSKVVKSQRTFDVMTLRHSTKIIEEWENLMRLKKL